VVILDLTEGHPPDNNSRKIVTLKLMLKNWLYAKKFLERLTWASFLTPQQLSNTFHYNQLFFKVIWNDIHQISMQPISVIKQGVGLSHPILSKSE